MATKTVKTTTTKPLAKKVSARQSASGGKRTASSHKSHESDMSNSPTLDPRIFSYEVNPALLTQVIHVYRDNLHQNTSKVKTRGELTRTTKKMYKQKGTGNARHGSKMSPTFVGGGIAFGPTGVKPNNLKINRKMRAAALAGILSLYTVDKAVELITVPEMAKPEVKSVKSLFTKADTLLVYGKETPAFVSSVRNLNNITLAETAKLNAYSVAQSRHVVLTPSAHEALITRLLPLLKLKPRK